MDSNTLRMVFLYLDYPQIHAIVFVKLKLNGLSNRMEHIIENEHDTTDNAEILKLLREMSVKINALEQSSKDKIPIAVKKILTMDEAAEYMGLSTKGSLQSIISEYKKENGKLPDWIGDGKGLTRRFVKRVEFEEWLGSRKSKRGRPTKQNT